MITQLKLKKPTVKASPHNNTFESLSVPRWLPG